MQTKVTALDLKRGMFISALDRPWIDTPFMLQGFLIENDEDLSTLRQYCEYVFVDWSMSTLSPPPEVLKLQAAKAAEPLVQKPSPGEHTHTVTAISPSAAANGDEEEESAQLAELDELAIMPPPPNKPRATQAVTPEDKPAASSHHDNEPEREGFFAEVTGKFKSFFSKSAKTSPEYSDAKQPRNEAEEIDVPYERPEFIPSEIPITQYVVTTPAAQEVAPAAQAHKRAKDVFSGLVRDIQSNKHLALEETEEVVHEVVDSMVRNPDAMMWVTRLRKQDEVVYGHGLQVAVYLVALGRHLGLPKDMLERLCTMGLLLDIGKIKLPKTLLTKEERLTPDEFEMMKSHVQLSLDLLKETPDIQADVLQGVAQHHERENGSGYPAGLSKDEISLFGKMAALTDAFAALTNPRSYAKTVPAYEALQTLSNFNEGLYQSSMVEQFIQAIGVFPVGTMVELSTGEAAIVVGHSKVRRLKPRVLIISDANKRPSLQPTSLDLMYQSVEAGTLPITIKRGLPTGAFGLDAREYFL
jgi:HD-GYP domain-containing protein (c-di-GMP phosphodiesterase class II)